MFAAGATEVYPQISGIPVLRPGDVAALESSPPSTPALRLEAFHPMGTAPLSADPAMGVTAPDGSVHGAEGLYVSDASLLPTSLGVNPMMTVIACASRISRGLAPSWRADSVAARAPGWAIASSSRSALQPLTATAARGEQADEDPDRARASCGGLTRR